MDSFYECPNCGCDTATEQTKLKRISLMGMEYPKYEERKILTCDCCGNEWPVPHWEIIHKK